MTSEQQRDEQLMAQLVAGDTSALEALYDRYAPMVMGLALRIIQESAAAEEVVQEVFWRVWKHRAKFRDERGKFSTWLFAITRNIAIDRWRRLAHNPTVRLDDPEGSGSFLYYWADPDVNVAEKAFDEILHRQVRAAIAALPEEQSQVILLAYFRGMTRQEISEALQAPLGTVHTRARLALQKLRSLLVGLGFEE